jgi:glycerophosphoryl diester phosphodiesterase
VVATAAESYDAPEAPTRAATPRCAAPRRRTCRMTGMVQSRPQVVAHRGASATNAEHTLGAYVAALDEGAEALECDVRLTADGHLVCVHDRDLRRTAHSDGIVSTMQLADLEDLDFAAWKNPWADLDDEAPDSDPELAKVLTMRRLCETAADYPRRVELAIETKHPTRYAGLVERRLVQLLDEFGWAGKDSPARIMSFSWVALRRIRRLAPDLELVLLMRTPTQWYRSRPFVDSDWIAGPGIEFVRDHPELVRRIVRSGTRVHCWTVNTNADIDRCVKLGVEAIITDTPGTAVTYVRTFDG